MSTNYSDLNPVPTLGDAVYQGVAAVELAIALYFMTKKRQRLFDPTAGNTLENALFELDVSLESSYLLTDIILEELPKQVPAIEIVIEKMVVTPIEKDSSFSVYVPYKIKNQEESVVYEFKGYLLKEKGVENG
ncbi:hypothetical protein [Vibrio phage Va2]|nr:hypothetical protein [Vibrio phage Va2]